MFVVSSVSAELTGDWCGTGGGRYLGIGSPDAGDRRRDWRIAGEIAAGPAAGSDSGGPTILCPALLSDWARVTGGLHPTLLLSAAT